MSTDFEIPCVPRVPRDRGAIGRRRWGALCALLLAASAVGAGLNAELLT